MLVFTPVPDSAINLAAVFLAPCFVPALKVTSLPGPALTGGQWSVLPCGPVADSLLPFIYILQPRHCITRQRDNVSLSRVLRANRMQMNTAIFCPHNFHVIFTELPHQKVR